MKLAATFVLAALAGGCQSTYVPVTDGRVSVIDLTFYPDLYQEQTVISYGYLRWQDQRASLLFDKNHITRRNIRFAIDMEISEAMQTRAEACAGQEVLVKGVVRMRDSDWVLTVEEEFVC